MIIIFGFRTPSATELPEVLYIGDDGVEANRIAETDPHPRIARLDNPLLRPYKHWTEEASAAFEKLSPAEESKEEVTNPFVVPTLETVTGSGYSEEAAHKIITRVQAMHEAWDKNPDLSREEYEKIGEEATAPAPPLSAADMLEQGMTLEELKAMADDEGIETPGAKTKRDYAESIAIYRELDDAHNAEEIKAKAHDEGVDVTGLKLKRDFLNAIVARRRQGSQ